MYIECSVKKFLILSFLGASSVPCLSPISHPYMTAGKTIALTGRTFVGKITSLLFNMLNTAAAAAKSLQSRPTLCDPRDGRHQLPRPRDSPGKNTGVGCRFLLQCMKMKSEGKVAQSYRPHGLQPTRLLHPWDFPGKSTGVGCQGRIF